VIFYNFIYLVGASAAAGNTLGGRRGVVSHAIDDAVLPPLKVGHRQRVDRPRRSRRHHRLGRLLAGHDGVAAAGSGPGLGYDRRGDGRLTRSTASEAGAEVAATARAGVYIDPVVGGISDQVDGGLPYPVNRGRPDPPDGGFSDAVDGGLPDAVNRGLPVLVDGGGLPIAVDGGLAYPVDKGLTVPVDGGFQTK